jgi:hypothetical protein
MNKMIKEDMEAVGLRYEEIRTKEEERERLFLEREELIREKERLEEQRKLIEQQKIQSLRMLQERDRQERERLESMRDEQNLNSTGTEPSLDEQEMTNEAREEERRKIVIGQFEHLRSEREKIIEERKLLYERMEKI